MNADCRRTFKSGAINCPHKNCTHGEQDTEGGREREQRLFAGWRHLQKSARINLVTSPENRSLLVDSSKTVKHHYHDDQAAIRRLAGLDANWKRRIVRWGKFVQGNCPAWHASWNVW